MCQYRLCLHLMDSLDAAFRGTDAEDDIFGSWGREVMEALQYSRLRSKHPKALLHYIALDLLQGICIQCPCEGLAEGILHEPERFLRTVVVLAAQHASPCASAVPSVLH